MKNNKETMLATEAVGLIKPFKKEIYTENEIKDLIEFSINVWNGCATVYSNWNKLCEIIEPHSGQITLKDIVVNLNFINSIYNTGRSNPDLKNLAESIFNAELDFNSKDSSMSKFEKILKNYNKEKKTRSLLSKYYAVQNPDKFPIYDTLARNAINYFAAKKMKLKVEKLKRVYSDTSYTSYTESIEAFREKFAPNKNYRELDKFLWLFGHVIK